jgi:alkylation response protein AidB-like acyl-CoA dehydrogenase
VGGIDQGWTVLAHALDLEHGGGFAPAQRRMLAGAVEFALGERGAAGRAVDRPTVHVRLARAAMHAEVSDALMARSLFAATVPDPAIGPMAKLFSADRFIEDAADLLDLCAPDSLIEGPRGGHATGVAAVEFAYRLSTASSIYGGTSEIMKSIVAQASLGLPRSRS